MLFPSRILVEENFPTNVVNDLLNERERERERKSEKNKNKKGKQRGSEREGRNRRYFSRLAKFTTAGVAPDS